MHACMHACIHTHSTKYTYCVLTKQYTYIRLNVHAHTHTYTNIRAHTHITHTVKHTPTSTHTCMHGRGEKQRQGRSALFFPPSPPFLLFFPSLALSHAGPSRPSLPLPRPEQHKPAEETVVSTGNISLGMPKPSFFVPLGHFWIHAFMLSTSTLAKLRVATQSRDTRARGRQTSQCGA